MGAFCEQLGPTTISMVREFYANMFEAENYVCMVRQRQVHFDRKTINAYYGLLDDDIDVTQLRHEVFLEDLTTFLCPHGAEWTAGIDKRPRHLLKRDMSLYFPSLVTTLCETTSIPLRPLEEMEAPMRPLTASFICHTYWGSRRREQQAATCPAPPPTLIERVTRLEQVVEYQGRYIQEVFQWGVHHLEVMHDFPPYHPLEVDIADEDEKMIEEVGEEDDN
ncbi:hypothetical protein H6P81_016376 [Aristolochia fimbriata]|uniref:Uncharacterized protein n=1 Tax=Aristolochia fimbriata TaxID=158543 RepID=A0AAV7EB71_ARIFI|nr:hypothetical protein H6P81_016376 [Aristolochia fimbriata]